MSGFRSNNIEEHNVVEKDIQTIFTVNFRGDYKDRKAYAVWGIPCFSQNKIIVEKIKNLLEICFEDKILNVDDKVFFEVGIHVTKKGYTLCFGSDQKEDIFNIYKAEFDELLTMISNEFRLDMGMEIEEIHE